MTTAEQAETLSPTKRAALALKQLQSKIEALEQAQQEPIAIVGIGCRLPGAESPAAFWQLLHSGGNAITEIPADRWDVDHYYSADPNAAGSMTSRHGGFVPHLYDFDAAFFRIAPREAVSLDPQQRLLLEVSWEALEQGGFAPDRLAQSPTGVFVGICSIDYWQRLLARDRSEIDAYLTTGNTHSTASGRLSHLLGFTGPSLSIDTACSSSLVAVHLACQSLRQQECDLALAAGVNRILSPESTINFSKARMLSPNGRCSSFDAAANGFVRAEGCGVVLLKRLRDAIAQGDSILATILGSAVNHDGRSSGLTVPNGPAQQAVIRQALQRSRIAPAQISYVEAHGTGTALGDPIEANALGEVFADRPSTAPLLIGSVKTNIGHTEAAAGMAGLIKVVLALQHGEIPANLHFHSPNPHIDWQALPLNVPTQPVPWKVGDQLRVAGVSAFGFNGSNAHVVVAEAQTPGTKEQGERERNDDRPLHILTLSARTEGALQQLAERYHQYLEANPTVKLADVCFTANTGRSQFNYRLAIVAATAIDLQQKLAQFAAGQVLPGMVAGKVLPTAPAPEITLGTKRLAIAELGTQLARLRLTQEDWGSVLDQLAQVYVQGAAVDWSAFDRPYARRKVALPTYPFQRQRYSIAAHQGKST
jgi:3-oxoacyl-[acyl-carrier-protein] synthase II